MPQGRAIPLCAALALAASCAAEGGGGEGPAAKRPIRAVDDLGREIALRGPAVRIAALAPGFVESLFAIGCGGAVALRDKWSDFPEPGVGGIPAVDGVQISAPAIAGFGPDLVLLYADDGRHVGEFERIGTPVAVLNPRTYEEVAAGIETLGALCGRAREAAGVARAMREAREEVSRGLAGERRPTVYVEIDAADPTRPWSAGPGSFVDELVTLAGGRNALAGLPGAYAQVSAEAVIRGDPDVVLLAGGLPGGGDAAAALARRPGWARLRAVAEGCVVADIDADLLSRPGPRLADGLRALARALRRCARRDGGTP